MENKIKAFRTKVTAILPPTIIICLLAGFITILAIFMKENFKYDPQMLQAFLAFEVVLIPFVGLILLATTFSYKITVYEDGISSHAPFGSRKCDFMPWERMEKIRIRNIVGYKYLFIESNDYSERLWIPLNIKRKNEFADLVQSKIGISHPLSVELKT